MENKSIVVARSKSEWINYVVDQGLADSLYMPKKKHSSSIGSKISNIFDGASFMGLLFKNRKKINGYQSLIVIGNNTSTGALLMHKLGILKTEKVVWWGGFFLHSKLTILVYKALSRIIESRKVVYVLFSEFEQELYKGVLGHKAQIISLPYGNWNPDNHKEYVEKDYYFSGGYSNRDYIPLIEAFRGTNHKLVIIASKHNKELEGYSVPDNVTLLKDVDKDTFHTYMGESKGGVIIPLKHNLGSSGQMVMIHAMARKKSHYH